MQGTQRSVSKAQELIDEALSTPDSTVEVSAPSIDRGPKVPPLPLPTSPSVLGHSPDPSLSSGVPVPPSSGGVVSSGDVAAAPPRQVKRYSEVIPSKESRVVSNSEVSISTSKPPQQPAKDLVSTSTGDSYTAVVCAGSSRSGTTAWTTSSNTFASITAATPSPTFQTSASTSPTLEDQSVLGTSAPSPLTSAPSPLPSVPSPHPPAPSLPDSDEDRVLSPVQVGVSPPAEGPALSLEAEVVDMNAEFPPLTTPHPPMTTPHYRSQSDPQVHSLPARLATTSVQPQEAPEARMLTMQTSHATSEVSSVSWSSPPTSQTGSVSSQEASLTSDQLRSEKLPFISSPKSPSEENTGKGGEVPHRGRGSRGTSGSSEGGVASLAVGTRPPKSVGVIQPTQQVIERG